MELSMLLIIVLIAFFTALVFSMIGLGGAVIYTPLFYWTGLPLLTAIPMALLLNAITSISASSTYLKQKLVDTGIAYPIITASIPGAFIGSYLASSAETEFILLLLSIILLLAAVRMMFFNTLGFSLKMEQKEKIVFSVAMGLIIGIISSMVGLGGGTFIVPLLLILGFETKNATSTSSFVIIFVSLSGFLGYLSFGQQQLDIEMLLLAGVAAFMGAQTGSRMIFSHTSSRTIEQIFAVVLLIIVGKLLYDLM